MEKTATCVVLITPDAERSLCTHLGVTQAFSSAQLDPKQIMQASWLYMEGYLMAEPQGRDALNQARQIADSASVKTALSLSDPAIVSSFKTHIDHFLASPIDLLVCNQEEAFLLAETPTLAAATQRLAQVAKQYALTQGAEGAYLYDGTKGYFVKAKKVKAIDTNGAGDMFAATLLYGLSTGHTLLEATKAACRTSAEIVTQRGARFLHPEKLQMLSKL